MTLDDLKRIPVLQTATIAEACKDPATLAYVVGCLHRFWRGDFGEVCQEDADANNADLEAGDGHALARYAGKGSLTGDIYIEAHFFDDPAYKNDIDYNYTMICYPAER